MHNVHAVAHLSGGVVDGGGGVGVERDSSAQGQEGAQCERHTEPLHVDGDDDVRVLPVNKDH